MDWVETTGKTVEEAKEAALDQLGVHESDAEFVVVSEPKVGFLGRVKGEARVRARVRPTAPRPKRGRSRRSGEETRRQGQGRSSGGRGGEGRSRQKAVPSSEVGANGSSGSIGAEPSADGERVAGAVAVAEGAGGEAGTGARKRRRRGGRGRSGGGSGSGAGTAAAAGAQGSEEAGGTAPQANGNGAGGRGRSSDKGKEETVEQVLSLEEQGESARKFVEGLVRELGLNAEVDARVVDEDTAEVTVGGEELGLLIGPGGVTLSALQEVTRTVVQRHTGGHSDRIMVDVAGYRAKRAEALARFARKIADEVLETGEERALEPMSPPDRKVVHDTVNEIDGVGTRSEGEEPRRYIVISPTAAPVAAAATDEG